MTNYEIVSNTKSFQKYIDDPEDLYLEASSIDKWELVFNELKEKGYKLSFCMLDLLSAYKNDTINELPRIDK